MTDNDKNIPKNLSKSAVRDAVNEKRISRGRGRTDAEKKANYSAYEKRKKLVFEIEKKNKQYLVLFLASDGKLDENGRGGIFDDKNYYIMGGNSAVVYVSEIGPRIGRTPVLKPDTDNSQVKFRTGLAGIKGLNKFTAALKGINIERVETKSGDEIAYFKLPQEFTKDEIDTMMKQQKVTRDEANALVYSRVLHPSLHKPIIELRTLLIHKIKNTVPEYRVALGNEIVGLVLELKDEYIMMVREAMNERELLLKMQITVDKICDRIGMMMDLQLWDVLFCIRAGSQAARIQREISALINKYDATLKKKEKEKNEANCKK
ncbi:hypothetical protein IJ076_00350 [Candidatus Saccharibacteria bacterium]|nr:hypothetical protein [Candidatus Saccharibacteria bacterium]